MEMYYKVEKTSDTGRKFSELMKRANDCIYAARSFIEKYGFQSYRQSRIAYKGGVSSCVKPSTPPDAKIWKEIARNEYMPKLSSKAGKAIRNEIEDLPIVDIDELNNIVGYEGNGFKNNHIGFSGGKANDEFFGFIVDDEWDANIPDDCVEITGGEYKRLFEG